MKTVWIVDGAYLFNFGKSFAFDYLKLKNEMVRLNGGRLSQAWNASWPVLPGSCVELR